MAEAAGLRLYQSFDEGMAVALGDVVVEDHLELFDDAVAFQGRASFPSI